MTTHTTNTQNLLAARPRDAFLSGYPAMLNAGATITTRPNSFGAMRITELIPLCDALRSVNAVVTAFACQPRIVNPDKSSNRPGEVIAVISDLLVDLKQNIDCRIDSARSSSTMEERQGACFVLEYAAVAGDSLTHFAALSAALAADDIDREAVQ